MYLAVKKFRYFIEGRQVTLFTDHLPLTFVYKNISDKWPPRQQRHLCFVSEFTTDVRYVPGAVDWGVQRLIADTNSSLKIVR